MICSEKPTDEVVSEDIARTGRGRSNSVFGRRDGRSAAHTARESGECCRRCALRRPMDGVDPSAPPEIPAPLAISSSERLLQGVGQTPPLLEATARLQRDSLRNAPHDRQARCSVPGPDARQSTQPDQIPAAFLAAREDRPSGHHPERPGRYRISSARKRRVSASRVPTRRVVTGLSFHAPSRSLIRSLGPHREISSASSFGTAAIASARLPS